MRTLEETPETVLFRLQNILQEAAIMPEARLHMNNDGLVVEYNREVGTSGNQAKFYEKVARFEK